MPFVGLDFGASFIKGALFDALPGRILRQAALPFPAFLQNLPPGWKEVSPQTVTTVARQLLSQLLPDAESCSGIFLCTQMHGFLLVDSFGQAKSNFFSWQDQRTLAPEELGGFSSLTKLISPDERIRLGNELRPGLPISTLYWLAAHKLLVQGTTPATIADFFAAHLIGAQPAIDATNAAGFGLFDVQQKQWDHPILERLCLANLHWPSPSDPLQPIGIWRPGSRDIPIFAALGDQQCALLGAGLAPGELSINIGTGSQVSMLMPSCQPGDYQVRPFLGKQFIKTVTHIPAGRALNVLLRLVSEVAPEKDPSALWQRVLTLTEAVTSTDLEVNLAFFVSANGSSGSISGLREDNCGVGHLFRAAFKEMARSYRHHAKRLAPDEGWCSVLLSGGLPQKCAPLRACLAQSFPEKTRLMADCDETLVGLRRLAALSESSPR